MKKVIFLILFFIAFNSINSIAKYSNIVEYNFLTVNILLVENIYILKILLNHFLINIIFPILIP